ncbi:MAG: endonuclease/exonuclease/phosphatase family protein [Streptosporangiaceae bacterium]
MMSLLDAADREVKRRVIAGATLILTLAFTIPLIARATGGASPVRTPLAALAPLAALVALAATALAVGVTWWLAVIIAIPAAFLVGWQLPPRRRRRPRREPASATRPADAEGVELRFLTLNAFVGRASPAAVVSRLRELAPDIFAVQELTPELAAGLAAEGLTELLPFSCLDPRRGSAGIGLWSRWPLAQIPVVPERQGAELRAKLDAGWPVTITAVHLAAPMGGRQPAWQRDMDRLLRELTEVEGQHLVAGDFNASRDHSAFRRLLAARFADSADAAEHRPWPGFTWPANRRYPPVMRLDHILVSQPGAVVREARTAGIAGSDHRALLAVIELRRPPAGEQP